ncbi:MAG TPA: hypothetical protein VFU76_04235 [Terriglobales bacterium]|nr:hypothetical protein [Terriglobales bacterium]
MGKSRQPAVQSFHSGDKVPQSGIYAAAHSGAHRSAHCMLLVAKEVFPGCGKCRVTFRLLRAAPYIFEDADFRPDPDAHPQGPKRVK